MSYKIVIPARLGSTRLPRKPLRDLAGKPMVQWVYEAALRAHADEVIVATDDQQIVDAVEAFGGRALLTRADHESGTDRLHEVAQKMGWPDETIVVNVQGDEPLIPASVIDQVANNLSSCRDAGVATLSEPILDLEHLHNPNVVKVVSNQFGKALYFSRAPIPFVRDALPSGEKGLPKASLAQRHIGIYAYRVSLLNQFVNWPVAPLEACERLEQLRVMANGGVIHVSLAVDDVPGGVDTQEDLDRVSILLAGGV